MSSPVGDDPTRPCDGDSVASSGARRPHTAESPSRGNAALSALFEGEVSLTSQIEKIKQEQRELVKLKKTKAKEINNATRRKRRLKDKARLLTDADLVQIIKFRRDEQETAAQMDAASSETANSTAASCGDQTSPEKATAPTGEPEGCSERLSSF